MAPIRRYLRITKYSVLEVRIYLDNPSLGESWLLNSRSPVLPRVIEAIRPLVLPKLREENERRKAKSKKKGVKDVVVGEDFEVSIFLTETNTSHALLTKQKLFKEPAKEKAVATNFDKITGADTGTTDEAPISIDDGDPIPGLRIEDSDDEEMAFQFQDLPSGDPDSDVENSTQRRRSKRRRGGAGSNSEEGSDDLFVDHEDVHDPKRIRENSSSLGGGEGAGDKEEDKKKMALNTSYDGYRIYGRVLCLVIKRRDAPGKRGGKEAARGGGQAMMEDWIASTQMPTMIDDDG